MIKKHKIIKQEQIVLYCDCCGSQMNFREIDTKAKDGKYYKYICSKCGYVHYDDIPFPFTKITFEVHGEEISREEAQNN